MRRAEKRRVEIANFVDWFESADASFWLSALEEVKRLSIAAGMRRLRSARQSDSACGQLISKLARMRSRMAGASVSGVLR